MKILSRHAWIRFFCLISVLCLSALTAFAQPAAATAAADYAPVSVGEITDLDARGEYFDAVQSLVEKHGVLKVPAATKKFRPADSLTRAEFVALLDDSLKQLAYLAQASGVSEQNLGKLIGRNCSPNSVKIAKLSELKDGGSGGDQLARLFSSYGFVLADADLSFRAGKPMTEREVSAALECVLAYKNAPKSEQSITRGKFAIHLDKALDDRLLSF